MICPICGEENNMRLSKDNIYRCMNCNSRFKMINKQLPVEQKYLSSNKFYNREYQSIRYHVHLDNAFDNPELKELCNLILS